MDTDKNRSLPPSDSSKTEPRIPAEADIPENLQQSLFDKAQEPGAIPAEPVEPPAITRDPAEPRGIGGEQAPRVLPEDEEAVERTEAEAGLEAAADEQAEIGRRIAP